MKISIVITSSRESLQVITDTIKSVYSACENYNFAVHLLLNGNEDHARDISKPLLEKFGEHIKIWFFQLGDKANCFNQYCYKISRDEDYHFFVDGYVEVNQDSIKNTVSKAMHSEYLAYTGIPTTGASSKKLATEMLSKGGLHGNFFMIPRLSLEKLKKSGFKLPIGLYRTDSTIGAAINFNYQPDKYSWNPKNICIIPSVTWKHKALKWYKINDLKTQIKRYKRQSLGKIENLAIRQIFSIEKKPVSSLDNFAHNLCLNYIKCKPLTFLFFIKNPALYGLKEKLILLVSGEEKVNEIKDRLFELKI